MAERRTVRVESAQRSFRPVFDPSGAPTWNARTQASGLSVGRSVSAYACLFVCVLVCRRELSVWEPEPSLRK